MRKIKYLIIPIMLVMIFFNTRTFASTENNITTKEYQTTQNAENEFLDYLRKKNKEQGKDADWLYKELEAFFGFEGYFYHFGTYSEHFISFDTTYFYGYDMLDLALKKAEEVEDSDLIWGYFIEPSVQLSRYINKNIF